MSANVIQTAFAAGELSPTLYARVDIAKYHLGAALMSNFFVDYRGGASNRPGTVFIGQVLGDVNDNERLIPFQFSTQQAYALEFGNFYMRVIRNGALVTLPEQTITAISNASPARVDFTSSANVTADSQVFLTGVAGMSAINGRTLKIESLDGAGGFLYNTDGTPLDTTTFGAYSGGGTLAQIFSLVTPWPSSAVPDLKFTQSADVLTITHSDYPPYDISRTSSTMWTVTAVSFATNMVAPTAVAGVASSVGKSSFAYAVTSVGLDGEESQASVRADVLLAVNIGAVAGSITLTWTAPTTGATVDHYNVYKATPVATGTIPVGVNMGFMGSTTTTSFVDANIVADLTITPPLATNPFASSNNPSTTGYFQQRKVYGGSTSQPETLWFSQVGAFKNFDVSNPITDSDAITATLASTQVNDIKYMLAMPGGLIVLTGGGAWQVSGGVANVAITPSSVTAVPQAYSGTADVQPIPINYDILYVQARGNIVRDLAYNFYTNIYTGTDIGIMSNHLLENFQITEWAYAEQPNKIVWAVRNDGALLSLTYLKEQEINGWARHSTKGLFQSVVSIPEGTENKVYFIVKRFVNGKWVKYIEELAPRVFDGQDNYGVEDAWFLDAALQNSLVYPAAGLMASAATGTAIFTADAAVFSSASVGRILRVGGGIATITAYTSPTVVVGTLTRDIQDVLTQSDGTMPLPAVQGEWSLTPQATVYSGLSHLEGQTVTALADGNVMPGLIVLNGQVTLPHAASKVTVGIPFTADLQTLRLDTGDPTIQGKRKSIKACSVRVVNTKGLQVGMDFDHLTEFKMQQQYMGFASDLDTGDQRLLLDSIMNTEGQIAIRQPLPLPATVLGVIPEIVVGDGK